MAVAATYAGAPPSNTSTSNVAAFANTTFAFVSGTLYILANVFDDAEATAEVPNSVVLSGATPPTVTRVTAATATFNTVAAPLHRMTVWWWIGDGTSRTITVTMPDAGTGNIMYVAAVTGADNSAPIVQGAGNQGDAGVTPTCTLAAFGDSVNNGALVFAAHDTTSLITAEGGGAWTELNAGTDVSHTTPASRISAAFRLGQDTSPSMTIAANSDWGCVAVEIKVSPQADATPTPAVIARSVTVPQVTQQAGASLTPATVAGSTTAPQASATASSSITPATVARAIATPQTTPQATSLITPGVVSRSFTTPQVDHRASSTLIPATVTRSFGVPQATVDTSTTATVGTAGETDLAQPLTTAKVAFLNQVTETDEAFALAKNVGQATELDIATPLDTIMGTVGTGIIRSPNRVRIYAAHNEVT